MKQSFLSRVFSMHPLALIAGACLITVTIPAYRLLDAERSNVGAVPAAIRETRTWAKDELLDKSLLPAAGQLATGLDAHAKQLETSLTSSLNQQLGAMQSRLFGELHEAVNDPKGPLGRAITEGSERLKESTTALNTAARAVTTAATGLNGSVTTVAEKLGPAIEKSGNTIAALQPGFENGSLMALNIREAIAPNLKCAGNGACWPTKVTAILGGTATALGEGGLIERGWRKETPAIAANVRGITGNAEKISHPSKILTVAKYAGTIGSAVVAIVFARKK